MTGLEVSPYEFKNSTSQFDISFDFMESDVLELTVSYNTDIHDGEQIGRMLAHFENLLTHLLKQPESIL
mgnify:CR=1 FL=1